MLGVMALLAGCRHDVGAIKKDPRLKVDLPASSRQHFAQGEPIPITLTYRDIPPGGGVVLYLEPPRRPAHHWKPPKRSLSSSPGPYGPLTRAMLPLTGSGQTTWWWDGDHVADASENGPTGLERPSPGKYRINAVVYDDRTKCFVTRCAAARLLWDSDSDLFGIGRR
jgi:hypothetical protein